MMFGLTSLGIIHTIISLVAVFAGAISLIKLKEITWNNSLGKTYVIATIFTCLTGFGIFQHGGFGKPHVLGIITLAVLGVIYLAQKANQPLGKYSPYIEKVAYSLTFFFHLVPGVTETTTRLPLEHPWASSPDDPLVAKLVGICLVLFLVGVTFQIIALRKKLSQ
ncbi:hypothetical protein [Flectobacillus longus]|uniref:hypothetical protein n=1 Tax=Flectobacillus longus TaxID=2984207 RepID=UPI0024B7B9D4|nr:hypothetical protein [Flectobacillus longus]MDI9880260.1 hypothetical protein [Flectobacillus longus]